MPILSDSWSGVFKSAAAAIPDPIRELSLVRVAIASGAHESVNYQPRIRQFCRNLRKRRLARTPPIVKVNARNSEIASTSAFVKARLSKALAISACQDVERDERARFTLAPLAM